jgi:hypothetical protein
MTKRNRSDLSQRGVMVGLLELEMGLGELLIEHVQAATLLPLWVQALAKPPHPHPLPRRRRGHGGDRTGSSRRTLPPTDGREQ